MPEFVDSETEHQIWKRAVLNREIELEDIDTEPHNYKARLKPSLPPSAEVRDMIAGGLGRPRSTKID